MKAAHEAEIARLEADIPNQKDFLEAEIDRVNHLIVQKGHEMAAYSGAGVPTDAVMRL